LSDAQATEQSGRVGAVIPGERGGDKQPSRRTLRLSRGRVTTHDGRGFLARRRQQSRYICIH